VTSCLLPYPSDRWIVEDPSTPTGVRLDVPADVLPPKIAAQLGPGGTIADVFGGADGFSPLTPIVFELPEPVDPATLPTDGGGAFGVFDVTTGERLPVRVEISPDANRLGAGDRIVMAWPVTRFGAGHRVVAVLTDALRARGGSPLPRAAGLDPSAAGSPAAAARTARLAADVERVAPGWWGRAVSVTGFVVRSLVGITGDVDAMAAVVRSQDHPVRGLAIGPSLIGGAAAVTGQVQVTDFRDENGVIPRGDAIVGTPHWVDFLMVLPARPASAAGAPIAIYGHGILASKETMLAVSGTNAAKGIATVGIDVPNHGSRQDEGGFLLDLTTPRRFPRLTSMALQAELDELSLLEAVRHHFGRIDLMPWNLLTGSRPDGVPELDPSRVLYEGTSMGGFLELLGGFLQVPGSGIIDTLYHSLIWLLFTSVMPAGVSPGDAQALVGAVGMLLDRADNTHLLDRIRRAGTPLWVAYSADDGIVPNTSTDRMLSILGLPIEGPTSAAVPAGIVRVSSMPADGTGATQTPTGYLAGNWAKPLLTHVAFADPVPMAALRTWLDQRLESTPTAGP
jgi:hypothetical protein